MGIRKVNLHDAPAEFDPADPEGFRSGRVRLGPEIGAEKLGGSVYELPPGQAVCPYHYELPNEEWAVVLTGRPTLRHPGGEDVLGPGDVVCFPAGPEGAHRLANDGDEPVRVLLVSTMLEPDVTFYPDSDKVGVFHGDDLRLLFRRESDVDYFDRET